MFDSTFSSVFGTAESLVGAVSAADFLLCCAFSVVLGAVCAGVYMFRHSYSKNFVVTLALLPLIVQMVITLVNGNLGAGIAVMGVFNLVRFRSIPGSAKDIGSVFLAMAVGLATVSYTHLDVYKRQAEALRAANFRLLRKAGEAASPDCPDIRSGSHATSICPSPRRPYPLHGAGGCLLYTSRSV